MENQLPSDTHYVWWYDSSNSHNTGGSSQNSENALTNGASALENRHRFVRDWYAYVTKPRVNATADDDRWESTTPLVWSETRLHLQKAWLATSSRFISGSTATAGSGVSDYETRRYYSSEDTHAGWQPANYDYSGEHYRDHRGVMLGQYTTALQYNQDFVSELIAYNYGDRNLDGVEFTYVMPRGVEPILDGTVTDIPTEGDDDLEENVVSYKGQVSLRVDADGLEEPIIVDVVNATGNVAIENFELTPNTTMVLGGDDFTLPEGDYWIVIKSVGTTPEGLPFQEGEYTYRVLVAGEDGKQKVEERTTKWKPLSFHITAHESMVEANPSETTGEDGEKVSTGIVASVDAATKDEKKKVYAENGTPVRLSKYEGPVNADGTNADGVAVITIGKKNYIKDEAGKFVSCTEEGRYVEVNVYDSEVPSQVSGSLSLNRIEVKSPVSVTLHAEGASPEAPGTVAIVSMTEQKTSEPKVDEEGNPVTDEEGNPVMEEKVTYVEGPVVEGYEAVPVAANGKVQVAELPRGHYGIKVTSSPQMSSELGGGLGYTTPAGADHFYVVGLGDPIEREYTLEHIWDASPVNLTVSAYGADTPAYVVIRTEGGDVVDPATGQVVLPAEGEETVDETAYRIPVTKDAKTLLATLPKGTYFAQMVQAPTMAYTYTISEPEYDKNGQPTGNEIEVEKNGTWDFIAPAEVSYFEADGHGTVIDLAMECTLAEAPAVVAGQSTVRIDIAAAGVAASDTAKYSLSRVKIVGEGESAVATEEQMVQRASVGLGRPVFLKSLAPGTYRLRLVESPKLADGTTFALPADPIEFVVEDGGAAVDLSLTLEPGANAGQVTVTAPTDTATFVDGAEFTFHVEDASGAVVPVQGADGQPAERRTMKVVDETVLGTLEAGTYTLVIDEQSWSDKPYLWSTAFTVDGTGAVTVFKVTAKDTAEVRTASLAGGFAAFALACLDEASALIEEATGL